MPKLSKNIDWELKKSTSLTNIYLAMKRLIAGVAREIVDTSRTAGEAWCRLTDRFHGRNVQGSTAVASQLQVWKRPTQIAESFQLLNVIRKLVREFARQSPKEPMPSAIVKAAYMRVVPETYRRAMDTSRRRQSGAPQLGREGPCFHQKQHIWRCTNGHRKHCTRTDTGTRSWQFQSEYRVKFARRVGQLSRPEQL